MGLKTARKIPTTLRYTPPEYLKFESETFNKILDYITNHHFTLSKHGKINPFKQLENIKYGNTGYKMGVGGLHSKDKRLRVVPEPHQLLIDADVDSYYPRIILNNEWYPKHLGKHFLKVYDAILTRRLAAKAAGDKVVNEGLKIVVNGLFGKLGSIYSIFYAPDLLLQITLTGQLSLFMLIERLEAAGIQVVSCNTDGVVALVDGTDEDTYYNIIQQWQDETNFTMSFSEYQGLYARDVNNYFTITNNGVKRKGVFTETSVMKNPTGQVVTNAVIEYIANGTPIEEYVHGVEDIRDFIHARRVTGGGMWNGEYLGKVVRWVYTTDGAPITYKNNGNKVAGTDGAKPLMNLFAQVENLDYTKYIEDAYKLLDNIGVDL